MWKVFAAALVAALLHTGAWFAAYKTAAPPGAGGAMDSLSVNIDIRGKTDPEIATRRMAELERYLAAASNVARTVRTYSVLQELRAVPRLAESHDLDVTLGVWISEDEARNREEIASAVELSRRHRNVKAIIVGNETILRAENPTEQMDYLIAYLRDVRRRVRVPVSTGETWDVWLENPHLANEVDFIAAHVLPYWESIPADQVVAYTLKRYEELRQAFPGKRIVIAEFGWPSRGYNRGAAKPGQLVQADILRKFIAEARERGIEYNIIEAFDQPWKTMEGSVGAYWGVFDAAGKPKFKLDGRVKPQGYVVLASIALAFGVLLAVLGLGRRKPTLGHALAYAVAANAMGAGIALAGTYPFTHYMNMGAWIMWIMGFMLMIPLVIMTLAKIHEMAEVILGHAPKRLIRPGLKLPEGEAPLVSIHIPAYREQPRMLMETLDSVAALDYPNFEAVVVINNTPEEYYWRPIEEHCRRLGARFKFLNVMPLAGFKAGALNVALQHTDPKAEVIAVIDADYVVHSDWLKDLVPGFADPSVGLVQAPQDHRDGHASVLKGVMNSEYAGFFDIGMVQRNEGNAIIQHGTMCMVRRSALEKVGGWNSDTIVEDTELGLRLFQAGYTALYTNRRYGWGVLPDTFKAFKTQRERWAYGAVQIIRKHWRHMGPGARTLTSEQKFQYVTGWMYWLSDALGAVASILNLIWVPVIIFVGVLIPTIALTVPIVTAFVVNVAHCVLLYMTRVKMPMKSILGAAVAAMSMQLTIAGAVMNGLIRDNLPFKRTEKGGNTNKAPKKDSPVFWETVLGSLLMLSAVVLYLTNDTGIIELNVFALTLAIQSLPLLAATAMRTIEKIETWRAMRTAVRQAHAPAE